MRSKAVTIDDYSSLFVTIRHFSRLFPTIRTIRDYSHYSGLFAIRYSRLFAIRSSGFPDTQMIYQTKILVLHPLSVLHAIFRHAM